MLTIKEITHRITPVLQKYGVKSAFLFGSYARGEATDKSDVDLRIDKGDSPKLKGLFGESGLRLDLVEALGCEVDMITFIPEDSFSRQFVAGMKNDEVKVYEHIG